jgi:hypothetical protein
VEITDKSAYFPGEKVSIDRGGPLFISLIDSGNLGPWIDARTVTLVDDNSFRAPLVPGLYAIGSWHDGPGPAISIDGIIKVIDCPMDIILRFGAYGLAVIGSLFVKS